MRLASKGGIDWRERESFRWFRLRKRLYQWWRYRPGEAKQILFIVGCQRSGTSMLSHLFRLDWQVVSYDEMSPLSSRDPEGFRLNPLPEVATRFQAERAGLIVCKPLVESQNLIALLDAFPGSRAIWMFRDHRDVVRSNLKFFGADNGHRDLAPILAGDGEDWRSAGLAAADRAALRAFADKPLSGHDAAALFWWARNRLYLAGNYAQDQRIARCDYDDLVERPGAVMAAAYGHLGRPYPGDRLVADVFATSRGKGKSVALREDIGLACAEALAALRGGPGARLAAD